MRAGQGGTSLVELLVALAVFGILAVSGAGLASLADREAHEADRAERDFSEGWLAAARLRADVERAQGARLQDGWLLLDFDSVESGTVVAWRASDQGLVRHGRTTRSWRLERPRSHCTVSANGVTLAAAFAATRARTLARMRGRVVSWSWDLDSGTVSGRASIGGAP